MTRNAETIILRAEGITKVFPGTVALDKVDFNVYRGKVNALIGENGAGKSTLAKIVAGVEQPTEGRLLLEDKEVRFQSTRAADAHGVGIIYQELNLFPNLSVTENIFMAREITRHGVTIDQKEQERQARALLNRLEQPISPRAKVGDLRLGEQQIVEIAKALARDVKILIMDEPTSALSSSEVKALFRLIRELKSQGVSIIYISHRLEELIEISDHVTVLRDGRLIAEAPAETIDVGWIVEKMVGGKLESVFASRPHDAGGELLRVESLDLPRRGGGCALRSVSFSVRSGEILGIYGLMGAGRTELFESLIGDRPEATGAITLGGRRLEALGVSERIRQGLVLVPEDRQTSGLVQTLSVSDNMTLASLSSYTNGPYLSARKMKPKVAELIRELSIKVSSPAQPITSLSGGNQQKVVVAKCLLTSPKVLLLDEPTRGIDVGAKAEMCEIMNRLAAEGLAIVFASSELEEVLAMADRVLVMSKGRITGEFTRAEATGKALVAASSASQARPEGSNHADA